MQMLCQIFKKSSKGSKMDRAKDFDLSEWIYSKWSAMKKRFSAEGNGYGLNSIMANESGLREGFLKACAVILEEADREQYCGTIEIDKLKQIIAKVVG